MLTSLSARLGSTALAVLLPLGLVACGNENDDQADASASPTTTSTSTATSTASPSATDTADAPDTPAPSAGSYTPPPVPETICSAVSADEMGEVLGGPVTADVTSDTDCTFTLTGSSITVRLLEQYDAGTDLVAVSESISAAYGPATDITDLGVPAVVAVGTQRGSTAVAGAGAVRRDTYVTGVQVTQDEGLPAATVKAGTIKILALVADQA